MTTDVIAQHVAKIERPSHAYLDRIFFSTMILVLWAMVLFGFSATYFRAGMLASPLPNRLIHVHGAVFTLWMVLLLVQTGLIVGRKVQWHRTLGMFGFGLAVAMVVLGILAANDQMRRASGAPDMDPKMFYVIPISTILTFAVLVFFSYRVRRKPAAHKRLILIATITISNAAIDRWPIPAIQTNPLLPSLIILGMLLIVAGYDLLSLRRVHPSTIWASAVLILVHLTRLPIGASHIWQVCAGYIAKS